VLSGNVTTGKLIVDVNSTDNFAAVGEKSRSGVQHAAPDDHGSGLTTPGYRRPREARKATQARADPLDANLTDLGRSAKLMVPVNSIGREF